MGDKRDAKAAIKVRMRQDESFANAQLDLLHSMLHARNPTMGSVLEIDTEDELGLPKSAKGVVDGAG